MKLFELATARKALIWEISMMLLSAESYIIILVNSNVSNCSECCLSASLIEVNWPQWLPFVVSVSNDAIKNINPTIQNCTRRCFLVNAWVHILWKLTKSFHGNAHKRS